MKNEPIMTGFDGFRGIEIMPNLIIDETARYFGCTQHRIRTGPNSFKKNYQRMVAIAVCKDLLDASCDRQVEKYFGLISDRVVIVKYASTDPDFEKDVEAIKKCIGEVL